MSPKVPVSRETYLDLRLPPPWTPRVRQDTEEGCQAHTHFMTSEGFGAKSWSGHLLWKLDHESEFQIASLEPLGRDRQDQVPITAAIEEGREGRKCGSSICHITCTLPTESSNTHH